LVQDCLSRAPFVVPCPFAYTYGGASALWAAGAAYFGYFAAAATGAIIGGAVGITHAAMAGESLADGFLFGVLIGAAAGATGYWACTALAGAVSGPWGLILAHEVQGAIVGFGDGLIQGLAASQGFLQVLGSAALGAMIGFAVGAAVQGIRQRAKSYQDGWFTKAHIHGGPGLRRPLVGTLVHAETAAQDVGVREGEQLVEL
jgi:hypothetical protein